ncbi:MAG: DNA methyltransferase [Dongiaceae bacterium]
MVGYRGAMSRDVVMGKASNVHEFQPKLRSPVRIEAATGGSATIEFADSMTCYTRWPKPTAIVVDGPYGLGKFPGDPDTPVGLAEWYAPHVAEWARHATPETTLWFWCSEVGWAEVHPVLKTHGWNYRAAHIWDKGVGHVAGNCNGETIRGFPVVTEICVQYVRDVRLVDDGGELRPLKGWLRAEWQRSGLPLYKTNEACGVKNAATRKYFTQCRLWYFPPPDKMVALVRYAGEHGRPTKRPYFSLDGKTPLTEEQWAGMRAKWNHTHGITNVWSEPAVRGAERIRSRGLKCLHMNQKPVKLIERTIIASTDPGDVVWEPFGGLFSGAIASLRTGRHCYGAEVISEYFLVGGKRLVEESKRIAIKEDTRSATKA